MQNRQNELQMPMYGKINLRGLSYYVEHGPQYWTLLNSDDYHFHDVLEIGICTEGKGICCVDGVEYPYHQNSCQIVLPSIPHYLTSTDTSLSVWKWVFIDPRDFIGMPQEAHIINFFDVLCNQIGVIGIFDEERFPLIADDVHRFFDELDTPNSKIKYDICRLLLKIISLHLVRISESFQKYHIEVPNVEKHILDILKLINRCIELGKQPSVAELAAKSGFSISNFRNSFKSAVGVSPKVYIIRQAVQLAKEYLLSTELSIEEISYRVGFNDVSNLYRNFVALYGISPTAYRQRWMHSLNSRI